MSHRACQCLWGKDKSERCVLGYFLLITLTVLGLTDNFGLGRRWCGFTIYILLSILPMLVVQDRIWHMISTMNNSGIFWTRRITFPQMKTVYGNFCDSNCWKMLQGAWRRSIWSQRASALRMMACFLLSWWASWFLYWDWEHCFRLSLASGTMCMNS